ncbi:MAG: ATP-binding protein [Actinomycetes bacterium]
MVHRPTVKDTPPQQAQPESARTDITWHMIVHDVTHHLAVIRLLAASLQSEAESSQVKRTMLGLTDQVDRAQSVLLTTHFPADPPISVGESVQEAVRAIQASVFRAIEVDVASAADSAVPTIGRVAMQRCLDNILGNAIMASGQDGHISVQATSCSEAAQIAVSNDSCGDGPYPTRPGHGIGLSIVRELVGEVGGRIDTVHAADHTITTLSVPIRESVIGDANATPPV